MRTSQKKDRSASQAECHNRGSLVLLYVVFVAPESVTWPVEVDQSYIWIPVCCCTPQSTHHSSVSLPAAQDNHAPSSVSPHTPNIENEHQCAKPSDGSALRLAIFTCYHPRKTARKRCTEADCKVAELNGKRGVRLMPVIHPLSPVKLRS